MSDKKVFVVFGATGNQGSSVINSVLSDPAAAQEFRIRGITRDPSKPNAQALAARGVECVTVRPPLTRHPNHSTDPVPFPAGRHQRQGFVDQSHRRRPLRLRSHELLGEDGPRARAPARQEHSRRLQGTYLSIHPTYHHHQAPPTLKEMQSN